MSSIHRRERWDIWRHDHKLIRPFKMKTSWGVNPWGAKNTRADHIQTNVNNCSDRIRTVISRQLSNVFNAHPYSYMSSAQRAAEAPPPLWERLQEELNASVGFLPYYSHAHAFTACLYGTTVWCTLLQLCLADSSSNLEQFGISSPIRFFLKG